MVRRSLLIGSFLVAGLPASAAVVSFSQTYAGTKGIVGFTFSGEDIDGDGVISDSFGSVDVIETADVTATIYDAGIDCDPSTGICDYYDVMAWFTKSDSYGIRVQTDLSSIALSMNDGQDGVSLYVDGADFHGDLELTYFRDNTRRVSISSSTPSVTTFTTPVPLPASVLMLLGALLMIPARRLFNKGSRGQV